MLLRFSDILRARIEALSERFAIAIREYEFTGGYTTVYPIKVNQQRHVIEEIVQFGKKHGVGLECGSKPELQAVLGLGESTEHLIICNGYKDEEFMRLALMGQKLGHQVFIVIEQLSEIDVLLGRRRHGVILRRVPSSWPAKGAGRWAQTVARSPVRREHPELSSMTGSGDGAADIMRLIHFTSAARSDIRDIRRLARVTLYASCGVKE